MTTPRRIRMNVPQATTATHYDADADQSHGHGLR